MSTSAVTAVLAYLPSPDRGVWYLGPIPIRAYALCIIVGIVVAVLWGERRFVARGGEPGAVVDIAVFAVPFGLVGGRLYHVATDWDKYFGPGRNPIDALKIWEGGLGIWGAVALGGVGAWIGCRRRGIPLPVFADAVAPGIVVAQAIGRLGNWFNQELYGAPTTVPWGLEIYRRVDTDTGAPDPLGGVALDHTPVEIVQPTFLYELVWNLLVAALVVWADRRFRLGHGRAFALYVAGYTAGRFVIEQMRTDPATRVLGDLRINVVVSAVVFVAAVFFVVLAKKGREVLDLAGDTGKATPDREREPVGAGVAAAGVGAAGVGAAGAAAAGAVLLDKPGGSDPTSSGSDGGDPPVPDEPAEPAESAAPEEPAVEEPAVEEPAVAEPAVAEPAVEEPAVEEPAVEEPAVEEPAVAEPAVEEPAVEEPAVEEPAVDEPAVDEPVAEESAVEEAAAQEAAAAEELTAEEPAEPTPAADPAAPAEETDVAPVADVTADAAPAADAAEASAPVATPVETVAEDTSADAPAEQQADAAAPATDGEAPTADGTAEPAATEIESTVDATTAAPDPAPEAAPETVADPASAPDSPAAAERGTADPDGAEGRTS